MSVALCNVCGKAYIFGNLHTCAPDDVLAQRNREPQPDRDYGQLFKDIHEWQLATFPDADAESKYAHLLEEIGELGDDLSKGSEIADCMMLLLGVAMIQGIDPYTELAAKLEVNKARKWAKTEDGAYSKHVAESP